MVSAIKNELPFVNKEFAMWWEKLHDRKDVWQVIVTFVMVLIIGGYCWGKIFHHDTTVLQNQLLQEKALRTAAEAEEGERITRIKIRAAAEEAEYKASMNAKMDSLKKDLEAEKANLAIRVKGVVIGEENVKKRQEQLEKDRQAIKPAQDKLAEDTKKIRDREEAFETERSRFEKNKKISDKEAEVGRKAIELVKIEEELKVLAKAKTRNPQEILDQRREATRQLFRGEDLKKEVRDLAVRLLPSQSASNR